MEEYSEVKAVIDTADLRKIKELYKNTTTSEAICADFFWAILNLLMGVNFWSFNKSLKSLN